ncbi:SIR2 family NAD-dependent protein deacylase [Portibacter lacus]|uniref:protein acetyllysine N-acetyltransferase n=1 Tax=Portibacter lacus TaxID=1099794 RepID=A0AA37SLK2_9BACT|nr:Sir2 family NAD-dependent protein deacetylase [Portibacter lacus]GLR16471.1 NAD-dependent protein deacylase [Portibacter lacus]
MANKKLSIISGAGISVASGLKTFRGEDGLWEGYDIMKVASIEGWYDDPALVLDFYNKRRSQLKSVEPNEAHKLCAKLEENFDVTVVTQNVDNLHERGGSTDIIHLHGELNKIRSSKNKKHTVHFEGIQKLGDLCPDGSQMRPDIVWFGEEVPLLDKAAEIVQVSEVIIIVGTSMQVYPAAGLISYAPEHAEIYYIDPDPQMNFELSRLKNLRVIQKTAVEGMEIVYQHLVK